MSKTLINLVNVINLSHRSDRMELFDKESKEQGFDYKRWEGVQDVPIFKGIQKVHKSIVKNAMDNGLSQVLIAEDDCRFTSKGAFDYFISQIKPDADFSCGLIYSGEYTDEGRILNGMSGTHTLYCVPAKFYDFILSQPDDVHCDRNLGQYAYKFKYYACIPFVCTQSGGYSDNLRQTMYYWPYMQGKEFYGKEGMDCIEGSWEKR